MMAQRDYIMAEPSVRCLLRHSSERQRLHLFKDITESNINEKCDMLLEILASGSINKEIFKPVVSKLIEKHPVLFKKSNSLMEELLRLQYVDLSKYNNVYYSQNVGTMHTATLQFLL